MELCTVEYLLDDGTIIVVSGGKAKPVTPSAEAEDKSSIDDPSADWVGQQQESETT